MTLSRLERLTLALFLAVFTWFTWRGMTMPYSGDDMMNMHFATEVAPWRLAKSVLFFWMPVYRPVGAVIYRGFYEVLGFHPTPLNVFCWLLLATNVVLAYRFFRTLLQAATAAFVALGLTLVHPLFQDLYQSAGTIYDRLWFFFTVIGLTLYAQWRTSDQGLTLLRQAALVLLSILSMSSKESGVALPVLMGFYEVIFHFRRDQPVVPWLRLRGPMFAVLALITLVDIRRVKRTPEILITPAYLVKPSLGLWLDRVASYFSLLAAHHIEFTAVTAALVLVAMAGLGIAFLNRLMLFGVAIFVVTITPVALISIRPGYVLYVPELGLGLWLGAAFAVATQRMPRFRPAFAAPLILAAVVFFSRHWPQPLDPKQIPEYRLTDQFEREFPTLPKGAKLLFVTDDFPQAAWDIVFNLQLLYHDPTLVVHRLAGAPQQAPPDSNNLEGYEHVFTLWAGQYREFDRTDVARSIREKLFADVTLGRFMSIARKDHSAYIVSGVMDSDSPDPSRWTDPEATFRFDIYPAPAEFHAKFWVPDLVAKTADRQLAILVNGKQVALLPMKQDGMNEIRVPVPAATISRKGYTQVGMNVQNPWKDASGKAYGVVILNAGIDYATMKE